MKYRQYSPTRLTNVYLAVKDNNLTVKGDARQFVVPVRTTLRDRTMGLVFIETVKSGRAPVLSMIEETKLVSHLKEMAITEVKLSTLSVTLPDLLEREHKKNH